MKKLILISFVFLIASNEIFSQDRIKEFEILLPQQKIQNSFYNSIDYLDSRLDTSHCGIVQVGVFNKKVKVMPKIPFSIQLKNVINSLIDSSAIKRKLLFQMRQLGFAEITNAMSEEGYFYLRAELYSKKEGLYQKVASVDTVALIQSIDVTKSLFRTGSALITDFIAKSLLKEPKDTICYSFNDVTKIDSIEKQEIFVYNTNKYVDGLYYTYDSFKNQLPEKKIMVKMKPDGSIAYVKRVEDKRNIRIDPQNYYCIVHNGNPFITTKFGYYRLWKKNNDFYFTGRVKVSANSGGVFVASLFFGVLGGILASNANATFYMKLDHLNGGFIHLREIIKSRLD